MNNIICFIDDSKFEHDLVREEIAPSVPDFEFVQTYTFDEARTVLGERIPSVFLLDLWGQDKDIKDPTFYSKEELMKIVSKFPTLEQVYSGLENVKSDIANEYLKRFFTIVNSWRTLFEDVCDRIGQNGKYGISNLEQARAFYPGVAAVFYTRKSLIRDAVAMFRAGADGLFIKPTGRDDEETRTLTREFAPQLVQELIRIILSKKPS